jgi:hypothetical protein
MTLYKRFRGQEPKPDVEKSGVVVLLQKKF